jgi:CAAX prenyl protease-like protein
MITAALSAGGMDRLYALKALSAAAAIAYFLTTYRRLGILVWSWSWQPIGIGALVFALWMALEPFSGVTFADSQSQASELATMPNSVVLIWIIFRSVGSILVVPLVEELAFRGFLTRRLIQDDFESLPLGSYTLFSFLFSSLLFGLLHGRWIAGTLAGALFAVALYRRGRLTDAVVAHSTANCFVTGYVLASGEWAAWS